MSRLLMSVAAMAAISGTALAAPVVEVESNNTLATANTLNAAQQAAFLASNSFVFDGLITTGVATAGTLGLPADVDFVRFTVPYAAYLTAGTFGIPNSTIGDSMMVLYRDNGGGSYTQIIGNDDDGPGFFSALEAQITAGTYLIGISMFGDVVINSTTGAVTGVQDGRDAQGAPVTGADFSYKLVVGVNEIPVPGAAAVLGLGALAASRRRRA